MPSPELCTLLREWGVENTFHSDLGVDTKIFRPEAAEGENVRAELAIPADRVLLLYVGRLAQEKNTHTLFEAFQRLSWRERERYHLLVVGDGSQRAELRKIQSDQRAAAVTHVPYCTDATRLAAVYRAADLFVHPGVQETFGLVTLEAQSCGTPVIGIRGSYMDRIIHNDQALWAQANSAEALAVAIAEFSHAGLKSGGQMLHQHIAEQYSWERIFARLFRLYQEVVAEGPR